MLKIPIILAKIGDVKNMVVFKVKELLEKHKISRYKLRQYTNLSYDRVNDYYFGRVKSIKVEELEQLCEIFNCNTQDIVEYNNSKKK